MSSTTLNGTTVSLSSPAPAPVPAAADLAVTVTGTGIPSSALTPKPGPTTTEFWMTLLTSLLAVGVAFGTVFNSKFDFTGAQPLIPAVSMLAAAGVTSWYAHSRSSVKVAAHTAAGSVAAAEWALPPV